jgi:hypothetical protein
VRGRSHRAVVKFGDEAVAVSGLRVTSSLDDLSRAEFRLAGAETPDYLAPVSVTFQGERAFTGTTIQAEPALDGIQVRCASGVELQEVFLPMRAAEDITAQDVVFAGARAAGFADENMVIQGLDELPLEPIEVVVPLSGVSRSEPLRIGNVHLLPRGSASSAIGHFNTAADEIRNAFEGATSYPLNLQTVRRLYDAERQAVAEIDLVLAWLAVPSRYGLRRLPSGKPMHFDRSATRSLPRILAPVLVRGLRSQGGGTAISAYQCPTLTFTRTSSCGPRASTQSRWLNGKPFSPGAAHPRPATPLSGSARSGRHGSTMRATLKRRRSSRSTNSRLRRELPGWLSDAQRERVQQALNLVGGTPLMRRIRLALERDRVPFGDDDWSVLRRLRTARTALLTAVAPL